MTRALTIEGIPDAVYERLTASAQKNQRSLNHEAIACLEKGLMLNRMGTAEILEQARKFRSTLDTSEFSHQDIDALKREGRA